MKEFLNDFLESWIDDLVHRQVGKTYIDKLIRVDYTACELMRQQILFDPNTDQRKFAQLMQGLFDRFASTPERSQVCYDPNLTIDPSLISAYSKDITSATVSIEEYPLYQHCIEYFIALDIKEANNTKMAINTYLQTTVVRKKLRESMNPFLSQPLEKNVTPF